MLRLKKTGFKKGFTLIELVIAMAMMSVIGLSLANLNGTLLEQRESAKTKTYIQGVMNRFLMQLKIEAGYAETYTVTNTASASVLILNIPKIDNRPSSTITYTYTNFTMVRTQSNTADPDPPLDFTTITVLPNYMDATIRFTCGSSRPAVNCFEVARVTVETLTPENRQTRITEAFGELGVTATDVLIYKPAGMIIL
jgi:prepilin-type N-terminal cleavage/methylation domain-containing protein